MLLGGSGLGPWAWARVAPVLEAAGLHVVIPTLSATGDDETPAATVGLDTWVRDVVAAIDAADTPTATLVAHSFAGYLACAIAERHSERVAAVIFVDANLPEPNVPWLTAMGPEIEAMLLASARDDAIPFFGPGQFDAVHPRSGLTASDRALLLHAARPQPVRTETQVAVTMPLDRGSVPMSYLRCIHTTPPAANVADWPRVVEIDTGHWPMLSAPDELADAILAASNAARRSTAH